MIEIKLHDFSLLHTWEKSLFWVFKEDRVDISVSYISDFRSAKPLRELTDIICKNFGIIAKWRTRIVLILDELHNNAIEYGSQVGEVNILRLSLERNVLRGEYMIQASVTDTGNGLKAKNTFLMEEIRKQHENEDFSHHDSIRGRGLFLIISHLVDRLYFEDDLQGWLRVGIEKKLFLDS